VCLGTPQQPRCYQALLNTWRLSAGGRGREPSGKTGIVSPPSLLGHSVVSASTYVGRDRHRALWAGHLGVSYSHQIQSTTASAESIKYYSTIHHKQHSLPKYNKDPPCQYTYIHIHLYTHVRARVCVYMHACIYIYTHTYVCMYGTEALLRMYEGGIKAQLWLQ
jgi:hypothetical protein